MSENNEMRKVFEDRQKDIYQGFEELSSYPDGKYLSHYVRCDFDWFQAAWEHQQAKVKELESQLEQAKKDQAQPSKFDKEDLEIGRQIRLAAGKLPETFDIEIHVERGYAGVNLVNQKGHSKGYDFDEHLSSAIADAIEAAINESEK